MLTFDAVDRYNLQLAKALKFDSLQLVMQPEGTFSPTAKHGVSPTHWTAELWDLRRPDSRSAWIERDPRWFGLLGNLRDARGEPCRPACWFACCMACVGSPLTLRLCASQVRKNPVKPCAEQPFNNTSPGCSKDAPEYRLHLAALAALQLQRSKSTSRTVVGQVNQGARDA